MTTPTITLPGLGRIDYTSPGSITTAIGVLLELVNSLFHTDLGLSKYTASAGLVLAVAGAVGWVAEAIVKTHPRTVGQAIAAAEHVTTLNEVKTLLGELHAAVDALPAGAKARVSAAEAKVGAKLTAKATPKV